MSESDGQVAPKDGLEEATSIFLNSAVSSNSITSDAICSDQIELETLYMAAPIGLCFVNIELRFVRINQQLADINGLAIADHIGRTLREVLPEQADALEPLYRQVIESGKPLLNLEVRGVNQAQPEVERDWLVNLSPLQHANGCVLGVNVMVQEVTVQKRLERDLREANQRLLTHWESMTDAYITLDREWRIAYANPAGIQTICNLTNLEPRDFLGKTHWEVFPWSVGQEVEQHYRRAMSEQVAAHFEVPYEPTGKWFETHAYPTPAGLNVYFQDISDRKQAELALQESESRFRTLADNITQLAWMTDQDGWIFWYNQRWFDYTGTTLEAMQGWGWQQVHHPDHIDRVVAKFRHHIETGQDWEDTFPLRGQDGEYRWFLSRAVPIRNKQGEVIRWFGTNTDIDDRKQLEEELRQKNAILNVINEAAPTPIFMKDRQGRIIFANPATLEVLGKSAAEVIGYRDCDLYPSLADATRVMENDQRIMASGQMEVVEESPDGIRTFLGMKVPYRNEAGEVIGLIGIANDITSRVELERDRERILQQAQTAREAAETANRIKDEFLAVLSHELRSPLNPILGWVKLLQSRKFDETRVAEALATIERNAKLQAQLIEDLLDISRIMSGKLALNAAPVSLTFVISAALETVRLAAEAKSIHLMPALDATVEQVFGDAGRLQQVVWNLLSNAVKFTPHQGKVTIRLTQVDAHAQIQVVDTGKGINPDFLPHVFEYFRQEDASTTRRFGGLGLGLAIARQIVEMHGGKIWVESQGDDQGATFTVQIPLLKQETIHPQSAIPQPAPVDNQTALAGIQVLMVDDNPDTRELLTFLLQQSGARVTATTSALEVLEQLNQFTPDILLSDIAMPEMDGYTLIRTVRSRFTSEALPAVAMTAYAGDNNQQQAIAAGFQHHIAKPIDPTVVIALIQALVKR